VEKDLTYFRKNFKEILMINDEFLFKDSNFIFYVTKCYMAYLKLAKKFSKIKSVPRLQLVYEVFLSDGDLINWFKNIYSNFLNKKFYIDLMEISVELLEDCSINSYISSFVESYGISYLIKTFSPVKEKLCSENYKTWLYYTMILSKISSLVKLPKQQFFDKSALSYSEILFLLNEMIEISNILDENKSFTTAKNNMKYLEIQICLQIQNNVVESLRFILRNKVLIKNFILNPKFSGNQKIINVVKRTLVLLFFDKTKIKTENSAMFNNITFNSFYVIYHLINEDEILNNFFKANIQKFCEYDFEKLKQKILIELNDLRNGPNRNSKFEQIAEEIKKKV
jgi:hypothetical protein